MFTVIKDLRPDIVGIEMGGKLSREEYNKLDSLMEEALDGVEHLRILLIAKEFKWKSFDAFWKELKMDLKYFDEVKKVALVTDTEWLEKTSETINALTPEMEVETFETGERDNAIKWLQRR